MAKKKKGMKMPNEMVSDALNKAKDELAIQVGKDREPIAMVFQVLMEDKKGHRQWAVIKRLDVPLWQTDLEHFYINSMQLMMDFERDSKQ